MSPNRSCRWWSEPLVHFIALGLIVFALDHIWQKRTDTSATTVSITETELERRAILFAAESKRTPTDEDLQALLYAYVEEEALVREALSMGLDEGDTIVRRRLAQKARFMLEDTTPPPAPSREEVCAFHAAQAEQFSTPPARAFRHVFIRPDQPVPDTRARALLETVSSQNWQSLGDPFILRREYPLSSRADIVGAFGPDFAQALFQLDREAVFQGPLPSAYGLHLVAITDTREASQSDCEDVFTEVESALIESRQREINAARLREIVGRYNVVVEE
jgi:hypothetical protein